MDASDFEERPQFNADCLEEGSGRVVEGGGGGGGRNVEGGSERAEGGAEGGARSVLSFIQRPISALARVTSRAKSSTASIPQSIHSVFRRLSKRFEDRRHRRDSTCSLDSCSTLSDPEEGATDPSSLKKRLQSQAALEREEEEDGKKMGWRARLWSGVRRGVKRHTGLSACSCRYYIDPHGTGTR